MAENEEDQKVDTEEEDVSSEVEASSSEEEGEEDSDTSHDATDSSSALVEEEDEDDTPIEECFVISEEILIEAPGGVLSCDGIRLEKDSGVLVKSIDFRNPAFLSKEDIRNISERYKSFAGYLSSRLAMSLRADVRVRLSSIKAMLYGAFTESVVDPVHISLFRLDGFRGVGLCELKTNLAKIIVDRVLGGKGASVQDGDKPLTEIETVLIGDVVQEILEEWGAQWSSPHSLKPTIIGSETCGQFLQTSVHDALMLVATIRLTLREFSEELRLVFPYAIVDQLVKFSSNTLNDSGSSKRPAPVRRWVPGYEDITVPVSAYWDAFELPVSDLLRMRAGDIIELPRTILSQTKVKFSGNTRFLGEVGVENGRVAVKLTQSLD